MCRGYVNMCTGWGAAVTALICPLTCLKSRRPMTGIQKEPFFFFIRTSKPGQKTILSAIRMTWWRPTSMWELSSFSAGRFHLQPALCDRCAQHGSAGVEKGSTGLPAKISPGNILHCPSSSSSSSSRAAVTQGGERQDGNAKDGSGP